MSATRIVSLVPSITELVCAIGLADRLVGRTGFCVHPREIVRRIPKVGGTKDVSIEAVRALRPTHVILNVDENRKETAAALAEFVPNLVITHPLGPADNRALYRQIGATFGREAEAEALCARFDAAYEAVRAETYPRREVLYLIWRDPWMTVSRDTYISRTLQLVNWWTVPAVSERRYPETALDVAADLVLLSSEPYRFTERHVAEIGEQLRKPVLLVDGEMTSWYGVRAIAGLRYLRELALTIGSTMREGRTAL